MEAYLGRLIQLSLLAGIFYVGLATWWLIRRTKRTLFKKIVLTFICAGLAISIVMLPIWNWVDVHRDTSARVVMQNLGLVLWPTSIMLMLLEGRPPLSTTIVICAMSAVGNLGIYGTIGLIAAWVFVRFHNILKTREEEN